MISKEDFHQLDIQAKSKVIQAAFDEKIQRYRTLHIAAVHPFQSRINEASDKSILKEKNS